MKGHKAIKNYESSGAHAVIIKPLVSTDIHACEHKVAL